MKVIPQQEFECDEEAYFLAPIVHSPCHVNKVMFMGVINRPITQYFLTAKYSSSSSLRPRLQEKEVKTQSLYLMET